MKNVRATLIELWDRCVDYKPTEKVFFNGEKNQYPMEIERVVANSPTATRSRELLSKYISGSGLSFNPVLNEKKGEYLSDVVKDISNDISLQYGSWIHRGFKLEIEGESVDVVPASLKVLDYNKCRKGKTDDDENEGKIRYQNYGAKKKIFGAMKKNEGTWYYPFSNDQDVILSQIKNDASELIKENPDASLADMLPHYRGQVYYLNLTPKFVYAVSRFDCVFNDCDTEYRMSLYSNTMTREGFLGKLALLTAGLDPESSKRIKQDASEWLGSEGTGGIYHLDLENVEDFDKVFKIVQVPSQYDDDMFVNLEKRVRRNILGAANNAPEGLLFSNDGGLFSGSGEQVQQFKLFYEEQTESERKKVEDTLNLLGFDTKILTLGEKLKNETQNDSINAR